MKADPHSAESKLVNYRRRLKEWLSWKGTYKDEPEPLPHQFGLLTTAEVFMASREREKIINP